MKLKEGYYKTKSILGLSLTLAKAQFKLRNEGSYLGVFWYLLEPFSLFAIILTIRNLFVTEDIAYYPLYLLLGLIMFNFFSGTTNRASRIITNNAGSIKSIKISYESLVLSEVLEASFAHFFEIILFIIFMLIFGAPLTGIIFYPLIFIFLFLFILGLSFILATLGVYINDLDNVWRVITRLLFFATPLFYLAHKGSLIYNLNLFNPVFYFISAARDLIIYNLIPEFWLILGGIGLSFIFSILGIIIFEKFKHKFAELV